MPRNSLRTMKLLFARIHDSPNKQYAACFGILDQEDKWMVGIEVRVYLYGCRAQKYSCCSCRFSSLLVDLNECLVDGRLDEEVIIRNAREVRSFRIKRGRDAHVR